MSINCSPNNQAYFLAYREFLTKIMRKSGEISNGTTASHDDTIGFILRNSIFSKDVENFMKRQEEDGKDFDSFVEKFKKTNTNGKGE